ncbi:MAG: general secretion pathway protein GspK [Deltaproteobacteria bacterium]|nr:general secretion pathway protein GspK [Deltaproteobacteria bacterium]
MMIGNNDRGVALFLVLWVLTLLSVIVGEFCYAMKTEVAITRNLRDAAQAYYIARAGFSDSVKHLVAQQKGLLPKPATKEEEEEEPPWRVNMEIPEVPFGRGAYKVRIDAESGKININRAGQQLLTATLKGLGVSDEDAAIIVDSILDWRDPDNFHRLNGAEDDYYRSLADPYEARDGDFQSEEELLLVRGISPELYFGGLSQMITVLDNEAVEVPSLVQRKTKKAVDADKVNINAAPAALLRALPGMTEEAVAAIVEYRREKDFKSLAELVPLIGVEAYQILRPYVTLAASAYYIIASTGTIEDSETRQTVKALVHIDNRYRLGFRVLKWFEGLTGYEENVKPPDAAGS